MRELEAMRGLVADLDAFVKSSTVGTVPATDVAAAFERHTGRLPPESKILAQLQDVAARYGVPLVSLQGAAELGLLSELGVLPEQVEEAAILGATVAPSRTDPPRTD